MREWGCFNDKLINLLPDLIITHIIYYCYTREQVRAYFAYDSDGL